MPATLAPEQPVPAAPPETQQPKPVPEPEAQAKEPSPETRQLISVAEIAKQNQNPEAGLMEIAGKPAGAGQARVDEIVKGRQELFGEAAHLPDRDQLYARVADRAESDYINSDEFVERRLNSRIETDEAGFSRRVYTVNGVTFAFRGREELPIYPTLSQSRTQLLGDTPNWISPEDYQAYQTQISETQKQENAPQHYLASKSLLGVVELATQLGSKDSSLQQLRGELSKGVYGPKALVLLDALVASSYVGDADYQIEGRANNNAEALVLAALLGDPQAQTVVAQKVEALRHLDQQSKIKAERSDTDKEPLKLQELVTVHATKYEPAVGANGEFIVHTTFDATGGKDLRNSVHTALNHKVVSHIYGSWGGAEYVLISPFESMIEANGVPTRLNTVDTWWSRNPGEPLRFPDATIVRPGGGEVTGLYEIENRTVKFKSDGLDRGDLISLTNYALEHGSLDDLTRTIDQTLPDILGDYSQVGLMQEWDIDATLIVLNRYLYGDEIGQGHKTTLLRELTAESEDQQNILLIKRVRQIIERSGATSGLKPEAQNRETAIVHLSETITDRIRSVMFTKINELAVNEAIRSRDFTVQPGGMWAWGDSLEVTAQTAALAEQLGTTIGAHSSAAQGRLRTNFSRAILDARSGGKAEFDWTKYDLKYFDDIISTLDQKTRRVLYASGVLTSRG